MVGRTLIAALYLVFFAACQPASSFEADEPVVELLVAADGAISWNAEKVSLKEAERRLRLEAARNPQPAIRVIPDRHARFHDVSELMAMVQQAGLTKLGVVGGT